MCPEEEENNGQQPPKKQQRAPVKSKPVQPKKPVRRPK